jgi:hypothetical protein
LRAKTEADSKNLGEKIMDQMSYYDYREKPTQWEHFGQLVNHPRRDFLLKQQLICIAFTAPPQVSVRAIMELLRIPVAEGDSDFRPLSLEEIEDYIARFENESLPVDYAKIDNDERSGGDLLDEKTIRDEC